RVGGGGIGQVAGTVEARAAGAVAAGFGSAAAEAISAGGAAGGWAGAATRSPARRARRGAAAPASSLLVPIRADGDRPPFFCVHPADGEVACYAELARELGPDQPFYGLLARGIHAGEEILTRVDDVVEHALAAVLAAPPGRPLPAGRLVVRRLRRLRDGPPAARARQGGGPPRPLRPQRRRARRPRPAAARRGATPPQAFRVPGADRRGARRRRPWRAALPR